MLIFRSIIHSGSRLIVLLLLAALARNSMNSLTSQTSFPAQAPLSPPSHSDAGSGTHIDANGGWKGQHHSWRRAWRWVYIEDEDTEATPVACANVLGHFGF
jgi:hypothetical protein